MRSNTVPRHWGSQGSQPMPWRSDKASHRMEVIGDASVGVVRGAGRAQRSAFGVSGRIRLSLTRFAKDLRIVPGLVLRKDLF